jgi:hypothetical protein
MQCKCTCHALGFKNHNPRYVWPHLLGGSAPPREVSVPILSSILWLQFHIYDQTPHKAASNGQFFIGWILFRRLRLFLMMLRFVLIWQPSLFYKNKPLLLSLMPWSGISCIRSKLYRWVLLRLRTPGSTMTMNSTLVTYGSFVHWWSIPW